MQIKMSAQSIEWPVRFMVSDHCGKKFPSQNHADPKPLIKINPIPDLLLRVVLFE